jgi:hypothetical protein
MLQSGTGLGKAQSLQSGNVDVIARSPKQRNEAIHGTLVRPHATRRVIMRHKLHLSAVIAMSLMTVSSAAFAQAPGGGTGAAQQAGGSTPPPAATPTNPGSAGISAAPGGQSSSTTGMGTGGTSTTNPSLHQPGTRSTSPGATGTGLPPNGIPEDDAIPSGSSGPIER